MALIIHIDSRCTDIVEDIFPTDSFDYRNDDNTVFYTVNIGRGHNGIQEENFSILFPNIKIFGISFFSPGIKSSIFINSFAIFSL